MNVRKALPTEHDDIYRMGYDAWGDGKTLATYLEDCRQSQKYARGTWYVLSSAEGTLLSSLICYSLSGNTFGIGSISTPQELRNKGYATALIKGVLEIFETDGISKCFLFSDIDPKFYRRLGFSELPRAYQRSRAVCMSRGIAPESIETNPHFQPPSYF